MAKLPISKLKRPASIVKRVYQPGMSRDHLVKRTEALKISAQPNVRSRITKTFINNWFKKNAQPPKTSKQAIEQANPFHIPLTKNGVPDKRYRSKNKAFDVALEKLWSENPVARDKLWYLAKDRYPNLKIPRRYVQTWLRTNESYSTRRRLLRYDKTVFKHGNATAPFKQINVDLKDMQNIPNSQNFRYVLVAVDSYSRKVYLRGIRDKTGKQVAEAMKSVLNSAKRNYSNCFSDFGSEFKSKPFRDLLKSKNVSQYFANAQTPQSNIAERFMGQLAKQIDIYKSKGKSDWSKLLPTIEKTFNNTINQGMGNLSPNQVEKAFLDGDQTILEKVDAKFQDRRQANASNMQDKIQYSPGDLVRIRLESAGVTTYSREPYEVVSVEYNRNGRDKTLNLLNYATRYKLKPFSYADSNYEWRSNDLSLQQLRTMAKDRNVNANGTRAQLIDRLKPIMQRELNVPWISQGDRFKAGNKTVAELRKLLQDRGENTNGTRSQLVERLTNIIDLELADKEQNPEVLREFFYPDMLLKYDKPDGKRGQPNSKYEQTDRVWLISYIDSPQYRNGVRSYRVKWVGWPASVEPRSNLLADAPRSIELYEMRNGVKWNDNTKRVTTKN